MSYVECEIESDLHLAITNSFDRFQKIFAERIQNNQDVHQLAFMEPAKKTNAKKNSRTYCYILYNDKKHVNPPVNLVFRFKKNAEISKWFRDRKVSSIILSWRNRLIRVWGKGTNIPKRVQDPELVTAQYGLLIGEEELLDKDFCEALDLYIQIAIVAGKVASSRKDRDWSEYNKLIK